MHLDPIAISNLGCADARLSRLGITREGLNSKIQWIKRKACGYRNRKRFHSAIYFHLADLDLYPDCLQSTHTKA